MVSVKMILIGGLTCIGLISIYYLMLDFVACVLISVVTVLFTILAAVRCKR